MAAAPAAKTKSVKFQTPIGRLSYPHLFKATPNINFPTADPTFNAVIVFPPDTDLKAFRAAATAVAKEKFGDGLSTMIQAGLFKTPFELDEKKKYVAIGDGCIMIRVKAQESRKPGIVGPDAKTLITDPSEMYAGCKVRASVNIAAWSVKKEGGVTFWLNSLQRCGDAPRIDGNKSPTEEFDPVDTPLEDMDTSGAGDEL